jgi:glycosyltransferase involved in cell wall biosynthesis
VRVLHLDSGREYRGGQDQVRLLARELVRAPEVEQRLLTQQGSELARRTAAAGVPVREVPWSVGLDPRAAWRLVAETLRWRPTLIHAHNGHAVTLAVWARGMLRWARTGVAPRVVATRRVTFPVRAGSALRRADAVVVISEAVRSSLVAAGFPPTELRLVPSGIDPDEVRRAAASPLGLRDRLALAPGTPLAVNVAALELSKDQRTLIGAAARARALCPELHWAIAGEGPERGALTALVGQLGLGDRMHLLGHVERVDALLAESDVVVMSSRAEGLGTVVLRAVALGKPVVATRAGGLPEIVAQESLVPVGDAAGLARAVVQALRHPVPVPLGPQFTAGAMARGVLALYRSLV